jgi:hypothetical protein
MLINNSPLKELMNKLGIIVILGVAVALATISTNTQVLAQPSGSSTSNNSTTATASVSGVQTRIFSITKPTVTAVIDNVINNAMELQKANPKMNFTATTHDNFKGTTEAFTSQNLDAIKTLMSGEGEESVAQSETVSMMTNTFGNPPTWQTFDIYVSTNQTR